MLSEENQPKIVDFGLANAEKRADPLLSNITKYIALRLSVFCDSSNWKHFGLWL
jgi:hypothetical protein